MHSHGSYSLTPDQLNQYDTQGFLHLRNRVSKGLLAELQSFTKAAMLTSISDEKSSSKSRLRDDSRYIISFAHPYLKLINNAHLHLGAAALSILSHPCVTGAVRSLAGPDFITVKDVLVCKSRFERAEIPWHQDLITPSTKRYRCFALGIYLDDSFRGDGAVEFLPGSHGKHYNKEEIEALTKKNGICPNIKAGDILIHDLQILHKSDPIRNGVERRTLYHEFRPLTQVHDVENWPQDSIQNRLKLMSLAAAHRPTSILEEDLKDCYTHPIPFGYDYRIY